MTQGEFSEHLEFTIERASTSATLNTIGNRTGDRPLPEDFPIKNGEMMTRLTAEMLKNPNMQKYMHTNKMPLLGKVK